MNLTVFTIRNYSSANVTNGDAPFRPRSCERGVLHPSHSLKYTGTATHGGSRFEFTAKALAQSFISVSVSASKLNHAIRSVALGSRPCRSMQCSRNCRRHRSISLVLKLDSGVPQSQSGVPQRT
jgi:hypothetical protein